MMPVKVDLRLEADGWN